MLKKLLISPALCFIAALWLAAGCAPPPTPVQPTQPSPSAQTNSSSANASPPTQGMSDIAPVRDAVAGAIHDHPNLFPQGTELTGITVSDGIAALDFNSAFHGLANMGDTTESEAQKQLRAALSKFPQIQKMRVTVQGKPFDSQTTDWATPFPVRETEDEKRGKAEAKETGAGTSHSGGGEE